MTTKERLHARVERLDDDQAAEILALIEARYASDVSASRAARLTTIGFLHGGPADLSERTSHVIEEHFRAE